MEGMGVILNGEGRAGFPEETLDQRPESGERKPCRCLEEEPSDRKSKCKGPEVGS